MIMESLGSEIAHNAHFHGHVFPYEISTARIVTSERSLYKSNVLKYWLAKLLVSIFVGCLQK